MRLSPLKRIECGATKKSSIEKSSSGKSSVKKTSIQKSTLGKSSAKKDKVKVAPVKFFGTGIDKPKFGYLRTETCPETDPYMEFMFGRRQGYRNEYNEVVENDEFEDHDILDPSERDNRESDDEVYGNDPDEKDKPGTSGLSRKKKSGPLVEVSATQWGPTQKVLTQNGTKRSIKIGSKAKQKIGKQGSYADDQAHSVSL